MVGEVLQVLIPAAMSAEEEARWVTEMTERVVRKNTSTAIDLSQRAIGTCGVIQPPGACQDRVLCPPATALGFVHTDERKRSDL